MLHVHVLPSVSYRMVHTYHCIMHQPPPCCLHPQVAGFAADHDATGDPNARKAVDNFFK